MLVIHPHFHPRRTGVTSHTEGIVRALQSTAEAKAIGQVLTTETPRITVREVLERAKTEPVVWHAHRNNELLFGLGLRAMRPTLAVVATRHTGAPPSGYSRALYRRADALITLNEVSALAVGRSSRIITHGIDLQRFRPPAAREAAWAALGQGGTRGMAVVGRVREAKGHADFARAWSPLAHRFPEWSALAVGMLKPEDEAFAATLAPLQLVPQQADIVPWYQGLDVVVHPSHSEGFSLVLVEAMACGACPVVSALPHVRGVVEDGRTGLLFEPGDIDGLRAALARIAAEPGLARQLGCQAAEAARARFDIAREAEALREVYDTAVNARRR